MKWLSKISMPLATLILCALLFSLLHNLKPYFERVEEDYAKNHAINLSDKTDADKLAKILLVNEYVANERDARFVADTLTQRLKRLTFSNLYDLQKQDYGKVSVASAESAQVLENKIEKSYERLGLRDSLPDLPKLSTVYDRKQGSGQIEVQLYLKKDTLCRDLSNAVVRLNEYWVDSLNQAHDSVIGFAKTDSLGVAIFKGLDRNKAYSVLPIKKGFEYGQTKGIPLHHFEDDEYTFRFEQLEHRIQMIDDATIKQIKNDRTITIRTPEEYKTMVIEWFVLVMMAWWGLALILTLFKRSYDSLLLSAAMFLSGLCVLIMYGIQNPLTEDPKGTIMASGVIAGVVLILLFQLIDFVKLYQNSYAIPFDVPLAFTKWLFLPFKQKTAWLSTTLSGNAIWYKKIGALLLLLLCLPFAIFNIPILSKINQSIVRLIDKLPKGFGWILSAIILTALLWTPLGREIGGMKVNLSLLGLVFQPSEIAKYLILFFMAAFFTQNADTIIAYSQPHRIKVASKIKTLLWVIGGLILLMAMYAKLGDMGPALVLGVTFVLLYSLVKSKVNLDNLTEEDKWKRIFTCDFAMLIYGVLSFGAFIVIGFLVGNKLALFFAILWFVLWIILGLSWHKQFFETAIVMNFLIFVFVFGGQILQSMPASHDSSIAERFEQRTDMCVNTWGFLDEKYGGDSSLPVKNTQIVNGLWALATGGMTGQGIGQGNPGFIPAFHTDMILSSIGEQIGWYGLLVVALVIGLLLRRIIVVGYGAGHPFAFYFCIGVAIVTGVQFFIIALGGSGMIPLTGITVPLLSYGRVSMILNLAALGVVMSMSRQVEKNKNTTQTSIIRHSISGYNFPISIITWTFVILMIFTLGVWQYYALWQRNTTLVRPAYVHNREGLPVIEYNPRIAMLTKEMWAGNIYDRNGVLLATSDKTKLEKNTEIYEMLTGIVGINPADIDTIAKKQMPRYYPFGEELFFMIGDQNSGLFFTYDENNPIGYMAEAQHLSYLRDYDNLHDQEGNPTSKVKLKSDEVKVLSRYLREYSKDTAIEYRVRNNHELVKYLKTGINGRPLRKHNEDVRNGKFDIYLTLDAKLQKDMQERMQKEIETNSKLMNKNLLRVSVVVLDAENGDLLTSANYPKPDYQRMREEYAQGHLSYSDNMKDKKWKPYVDRDLGLTYQTMPGSTAKVMSAMAGLQKMGSAAADKKYLVTLQDIIEAGSAKEPFGYEVTMRDAIVKSSNCYFINLVNDNDLYDALDSVYEATGVGIGNVVPYFFDARRAHSVSADFKAKIHQNRGRAIAKYAARRAKKQHKKMNEGEWRWAWGQGYKNFELQASPLNMARVASAVINHGIMPNTQYVLAKNDYTKQLRNEGSIPLMSSQTANILKDYMMAEAANQKSRNGTALPSNVGGKTGTPERYRYINHRSYDKCNDGWYMFFVEGKNGKHSLAVCVRMEREVGSGPAVRFSNAVILESLYANGYIN